MTEHEKFKSIFHECSIWRGAGLDNGAIGGTLPVMRINFAVSDRKGLHKKYVEFDFIFDHEGTWVDTREIK